MQHTACMPSKNMSKLQSSYQIVHTDISTNNYLITLYYVTLVFVGTHCVNRDLKDNLFYSYISLQRCTTILTKRLCNNRYTHFVQIVKLHEYTPRKAVSKPSFRSGGKSVDAADPPPGFVATDCHYSCQLSHLHCTDNLSRVIPKTYFY